MTGTKKQTSQKILDKLITHWPGHYIVGSKPYQKGCKIYLTENNQLIDTFDKNEDAYTAMVGDLTKKLPWWPGKRKEQVCEFFDDKIQIQSNALILQCTAKKILDLRDESDRLMKTIMVNPFNPEWRDQVIQIIKS